MKKVLLLSILALFVLSMSAFGTETRTLTLGQTNNVLLDEANIWLYPSRILDYPNLAIGEFGYDPEDAVSFGANDFARFGIHFKSSRDNSWVAAGYFDNAAPIFPDDILFGGPILSEIEDMFEEDLFFEDFDQLENRRINFFYGRRLGDLNFGLLLGLAHSSQTFEVPEFEEFEGGELKESFHRYSLSAGLTAPDGAWDVAARLAMLGFTDEDFSGDPQNESDGMYDFGLSGRLFHTLNPNYVAVPHASFMYAKRGVTNFTLDGDLATEDFSLDMNTLVLNLGIGLNYTPATNVLAVADFGIQYAKGTWEASDGDETLERDLKQFTLPYFKIGLDADIFRWLDVRMGATSFWNRDSDEMVFEAVNGEISDRANYASNETYLGFGFHWGRFHVDTYTDPELFLDGFNFISGRSTDMNFQISAVYEMM